MQRSNMSHNIRNAYRGKPKPQDVLNALQVIKANNGISNAELANLCSSKEDALKESTVAHYCAALSEYKYFEGWLPKIVRYLGNQCGDGSQPAFKTVAEMVNYARTHYELPAGKEWSQPLPVKGRPSPELLEQVELCQNAVRRLLSSKGTSLGIFTDGSAGMRNVMEPAASLRISPELALNRIEELAGRIRLELFYVPKKTPKAELKQKPLDWLLAKAAELTPPLIRNPEKPYGAGAGR